MPLNTEESREEIKEQLSGKSKIYIDGTEQSIRRPKNNSDQKLNYSGKKKQHTSKVLLVSEENKKINALTPVYFGSTHDFSILKEEGFEKLLPLKTPIYVDTGFEGIKSINENLNIRKPKKKKKNRKLNGGEKLGNRLISKERVKVEHAIGGMKRFKIISNKFRGISHSMNITFQLAAGLWNLHVEKMLRTPLQKEASAL